MPRQQAAFDPNQDPEESRRVRLVLRGTIQDIEEHQAEYSEPGSERALQTLREVAQTSTHVKQSREGVLVGEAMVMLANIGTRQVGNLRARVQDFNDSTLINNLTKVYQSRGVIDWELVGRQAMSFTKPSPRFTIMYGPLDKEPKKRAVVHREKAGKKFDKTKAVAPEQNVEENDTDLATTRVNEIAGILNDVLAVEPCVSFFKFVVNPFDFGQTVENIFHLSFLIKDGDIRLYLDESGLPCLSKIGSNGAGIENEDDDGGETRIQNVMGISVSEWEDIKKAFDITECMIPNRETEE